MKSKLVVFTAMAALPATLFGGYFFLQRQQHAAGPLFTTGSEVPPGHVAGNVDETLKRCRQLWTLVKNNNWCDGYSDSNTPVPYEMLTLPDQKFAEHPHHRTSTAFWFPENQKGYEDVAFFTDIYVRQNTSYYKGDKAVSEPSGFLIVCYKDGRIDQVPTRDIRMMTAREGICVPGMKAYTEDRPKPPYLKESPMHKVK